MKIDKEVLTVINEDYQRKVFKRHDYSILSNTFSTRGGPVKVEFVVSEFDEDGNIACSDLIVNNKLAATFCYEEGTDTDYAISVDRIAVANEFLFSYAIHLMIDNILTDETIVYGQDHPSYKKFVNNPDYVLED